MRDFQIKSMSMTSSLVRMLNVLCDYNQMLITIQNLSSKTHLWGHNSVKQTKMAKDLKLSSST